MKKIIIFSLLCAAVLTGCSQSSAEQPITETVSEETYVTTESATETAEPTETATKPVYDYVHGENGYFNLAEEGNEFTMGSQVRGTCWAYASVAAMESAYFMKHNAAIEFDPLDIVDVVYDKDKPEGLFVADGKNKRDAGGWAWGVCSVLANGYNGMTVDRTVSLESLSTDEMKDYIRNNGAVVIAVLDYDYKKGWHGNYLTMNDSVHDEPDHDVTLIGWDDHFPKEYFNESAKNDGAWICYNGTLGSAGYYYISYDTGYSDPIAITVTDEYTDVLSYDCGTLGDYVIDLGDETVIANVFDKPGTLAAVGTYCYNPAKDITIEVYTGDFSELLYSQDAVLDCYGYHTIKLDTPLEVDNYALAIRFKGSAPVEPDSFVCDDDEIIFFRAVSEKGQSYVLIDGQWKDLAEEETKTALGLDFTPKNACIKALYTG